MTGGFGRHDRNIFAETVDQYSDHVVFRLQGDIHFLSPVHSEETSCVAGKIEFPEFLPSFPVLLRQGDLQHLVYPVMFDFPVKRIEPHEVIVFIIPHQLPGADIVPVPVFAQFHFLFHIPAIILETDPYILSDGFMELIDIIINTFVNGFDPPRDRDLAVKLRSLMPAYKGLEFSDQLLGFFVRDKFGGLNCIDEQL